MAKSGCRGLPGHTTACDCAHWRAQDIVLQDTTSEVCLGSKLAEADTGLLLCLSLEGCRHICIGYRQCRFGAVI